MKTILALLLSLFAARASAETVTLYSSKLFGETNDSAVVAIQSNQVAKVVFWSVKSGPTSKTSIRIISNGGTLTNDINHFVTNSLYSDWVHTPFPNALPVVCGPSTIQLISRNSDGSSISTIQITTETPALGSAIPVNTVVIPEDTNGPVTILLESSSDLVSWTAANPGTYGTTHSNRFFRVRAVR
ncbi:MAG: hypothetical protein ABIR24_11840 [Verrucomicrobiota bacterium]